MTFPQRRKLTELHFNKVWELPNQTVALKETAKNNKTNYKKKEKKEAAPPEACRSLVTVPGTLRRVVYIAPRASAGYRGCIPWWRRSHHPRSPSSQEEEKQQLSCFFFFSSLNSLPLQCDVSFFHSHTTTWADRIDFPLACGSISPLSLVLHTHTHTTHTHAHTHTH